MKSKTLTSERAIVKSVEVKVYAKIYQMGNFITLQILGKR